MADRARYVNCKFCKNRAPLPAAPACGKVSYTGGGPNAPMAGAGTYTVTLDGKGGTIKQTHTGKVTIPFGGTATHTDVLKLTPIPPC